MALVAVTDDPVPNFDSRCHGFTRWLWFTPEYWWLYDRILELEKTTGLLIDPQQTAFFKDANLVALAAFLKEAHEAALGQPEEWQQYVGTRSGAPNFERACRSHVLELLDGIDKQVVKARRKGMGVMFIGE